MKLTYTATQKDEGRRVLSVMRASLCISSSLTRRLKQCGAICVDGSGVYTNYVLKEGQTLTIDLSAVEPESDLIPESGEIEVLYEDGGLLAVNKPCGMLVHPTHSRNDGTLANYVYGYIKSRDASAGCHAVNRLDRDTSGVILFAKSAYHMERAASALSSPDCGKEYIALIHGEISPACGTIDLPIDRPDPADMKRAVSPNGQRAVTHYETLSVISESGHKVSVIRLKLETGRTHQIRVHLSHLGCPILGDRLYGTEESFALSQALGIGAQALHARKLSFINPANGELLEISAELKREDIKKLIERYEIFY